MEDTYDPTYDPFQSEKYGEALRERFAQNLKHMYGDASEVRFTRVWAERSRKRMVKRDRAEEIDRIVAQCQELIDAQVDGVEDAQVIRKAVLDKLWGWTGS